jgi:cobalt-zinc-cadmium resistance protein CzcA
MVTYFQQLHGRGASIEQAARQAAEKRFRPVLMTTLVATLGLLPAALSHGIGSQERSRHRRRARLSRHRRRGAGGGRL